MAANDRGSKSDTAFHPLFATEKHSDTIFESSDGISFYYDWDRLAVFSSFFEDLKSINNVSREAVHTEKEAVIPLPTTSAALAYALGAINTTLRGSPPPELELVHFNDVLTLADSLELPMVTHVLLRTAKAAQMTPCIVVVLSILAQDTSDFRDLSLALLAHPVDHMSTWSLESLKRPNDGTAFRFPHEILSLFSTWFNHIRTPVHQAGGSNSANMIHLPFATARSLAYSFWAIVSVVRGSRPPPLPTTGNESDFFDEIIEVTNKYDLPVVLRALFRTVKATKPPPSAFTLYTLAALSDSTDEVKDLSLDLLGTPILGMEEWNESTLSTRVPFALLDLRRFFSRFNDALDRFVQAPCVFQFNPVCKRITEYYDPPVDRCVRRPQCTVCREWDTPEGTQSFAKHHLMKARKILNAYPKLIHHTDFYTPETGCTTCDNQVIAFLNASKQTCILPADYTFDM
ncbi:hypothetical protein CspHIS471_0608530 [Cutaneotrichosporon sp. HIS471]|nr:hypothetical protein CspHIS471_0608530 [Cutaneotrichosporon sp. HIS471]